MYFFELLEKYTVDEITNYYRECFPDNSIVDEIPLMIKYFKTFVKPIPYETNYQIVVDIGKGETYVVDYSKPSFPTNRCGRIWEELAMSKISERTLKYTDGLVIIVEVIWEMTVFGYDIKYCEYRKGLGYTNEL